MKTSLRDLDECKKYYEEFLEKYPESDFADDAEMSLKNLGKTPEELIMEFEKNQNKKKRQKAAFFLIHIFIKNQRLHQI